ncbi:TniQ family protein [Paenibacillus sp. LjRoot153]|uniref:TniQ family protein n=1 Tax=Paenibacillus sp. LjRoot153 TaxID=3342270 RepID=UPI003ECC63A3
MFTVRLLPKPGELLSSFLLRFAKANGTSLLTLWRKTKNSELVNSNKVDLLLIDFAPLNAFDIKLLSKATKIAVENLLEMSFHFALKKFCHSNELVRSRFLKGVIRVHLHYCPQCLNEKVPFIKKEWKVEGNDYCLNHHLRLINVCNICGNKIKLTQINEISNCPLCEASLGFDMHEEIISEEEHRIQSFHSEIWKELCENNNDYLTPSETATKLLYILNEKQTELNMSIVQPKLHELGTNAKTFMQYVRNTRRGQNRTLHINLLINVFYRNKIPLRYLFEMKIPNGFRKAIIPIKKNEFKNAICLSPWCNSYMKNELLVRSGTVSKKRKNGEILRGYSACLACGCRFAYDEEGELQAIDFFAQGYEVLNLINFEEVSSAELVRRTGLSISTWRRIIIYFQVRGLYLSNSDIAGIIDNFLLDKFTNAINCNVDLNTIAKWECWKSKLHFLFHRYHPEIMKKLILHKRPAMERRIDRDGIRGEIVQICEELFKSGQVITIGVVSEKLKVRKSTLSKWGLNDYIHSMKAKQHKENVTKLLPNWYSLIDEFFNLHNGEKVLTEEVYAYIKLSQSYIRRVAPEVNRYINEMRLRYNSEKHNLNTL